MYLVITRTFPPELGGMQNLMWGLARSLSKLNLIKVFADYHENHEEFDNTVSFSIERVSGMKLIRKYRKSYLINDYIENNIFDVDPFISIDEGVGDLIEIATLKGRKQNKKLKLGICGEHGGDPKSINFCSSTGLNYVSCSPYRVPVARLAAAQAQLKK